MTKNKSSIKKIMVLALTTVLISALSIPVADQVDAAVKSYKGLKYVIKGRSAEYGSGVYIKSYSGSKTSIKIPKKIKGRYVVSIDLDEEYLKKINVKKVTKLKHLDLSENRIKSVNLKYNKQLKELDISENKLAKLTVKYNRKLVELDASDNKIKSISLKKNTKLRELDLSGNKLTKLNISKNLKLKDLDIQGNKGLSWFTVANLSKHTKMKDFTDSSGREWEKKGKVWEMDDDD